MPVSYTHLIAIVGGEQNQVFVAVVLESGREKESSEIVWIHVIAQVHGNHHILPVRFLLNTRIRSTGLIDAQKL